MKTRFWGMLWRFILVNPLLFVLDIVIKDSFFVPCNSILEKRFILKADFLMSDLSLFFSVSVWGTNTLSLLTFSIFFKWWHILIWNVLKPCINYQALFHRLHSTNSLIVSLSKTKEHLSLGSSLNDTTSEWDFENHFRASWSVMSSWS